MQRYAFFLNVTRQKRSLKKLNTIKKLNIINSEPMED